MHDLSEEVRSASKQFDGFMHQTSREGVSIVGLVVIAISFFKAAVKLASLVDPATSADEHYRRLDKMVSELSPQIKIGEFGNVWEHKP